MLAISESKLVYLFPDSQFLLEGYLFTFLLFTFFRPDRPDQNIVAT